MASNLIDNGKFKVTFTHYFKLMQGLNMLFETKIVSIFTTNSKAIETMAFLAMRSNDFIQAISSSEFKKEYKKGFPLDFPTYEDFLKMTNEAIERGQ